MTQLGKARTGNHSEEMSIVAAEEGLPLEKLMKDIAAGRTIICKSARHDCKPIGIGKDLRIKINSNIGTSNFNSDVEQEIRKLKASVEYGAHTVMDLSTGGDISDVRKRILAASPVPIGTVPIYQAISRKEPIGLGEDDFLDSIRLHIEDGVDFITVHCGLTRECIPMLKSRIMGVVSRGGSFLVKWMTHHKRENPLFTRYDDIVAMAKEYDVCLSLGDGLRPGCLADATDETQLTELKTLGQLAKRAQDQGVQVMIEGPGHVPINEIKKNMRLQKEYCNDAPFYVLGPLVTDISPGYDHITGAIGGAIAAMNGADFLCYLTPKEHLGLPDLEDVIDGVVASRIAAHAADVGRGIPGARDVDDEMSRARSNLDWEKMYRLSMNPAKARAMRKTECGEDGDVCSMCGDLCSAKINMEARKHY